MFELHVVVAGFVMFNIMELIMKIVPNYPTIKSDTTPIHLDLSRFHGEGVSSNVTNYLTRSCENQVVPFVFVATTLDVDHILQQKSHEGKGVQ
jgi:hypothetical protein